MSSAHHPLFDLRNRVAIVTGGGSGLGREFCDVLAEFGASVICADLNHDGARETCEIIEKHGGQAIPIQADVSDYDQVRMLFNRAEERYESLDVLVNNAGIISRGCAIDQTDIRNWQKVLNVNVNGVFYCMREGLRLMLRQKKGSVINITSITGLCGVDPEVGEMAPYVTSKSAIIGLTRQAAAEYGARGIRVNGIAPGWHLGTGLGPNAGIKRTEKQLKAFERRLSSRTPMKRTGQLKELRGLLVYLASDASSFVTGQIISSDGGWTCI